MPGAIYLIRCYVTKLICINKTYKCWYKKSLGLKDLSFISILISIRNYSFRNCTFYNYSLRNYSSQLWYTFWTSSSSSSISRSLFMFLISVSSVSFTYVWGILVISADANVIPSASSASLTVSKSAGSVTVVRETVRR